MRLLLFHNIQLMWASKSSPFHMQLRLQSLWTTLVFLFYFSKCSLAVWWDPIESALCAEREITCSDISGLTMFFQLWLVMNIMFLTDAALNFSVSLAWPDSLIVSSSSKCNWPDMLTFGFCNWLDSTSPHLLLQKNSEPFQRSRQSCIHHAACLTGRGNNISPPHLTQISDTSQDITTPGALISHFTCAVCLLARWALLWKVLSDLFTFALLGKWFSILLKEPIASPETDFFFSLRMWNKCFTWVLIEFRLLSGGYQQSLGCKV